MKVRVPAAVLLASLSVGLFVSWVPYYWPAWSDVYYVYSALQARRHNDNQHGGISAAADTMNQDEQGGEEAAASLVNKIDSNAFYNEYHGHLLVHLRSVLAHWKHGNNNIRRHSHRIWLVGDSSLDNKAWLGAHGFRHAAPAYINILSPARSRPDVAFHLNMLGNDHASPTNCWNTINCAVEESTLAQRRNLLLPHDRLVRDNLTPDDVLVVSVGGNDIALRPSLQTMWNMLKMMKMNSVEKLAQGPSDAWGMPYFAKMFGDDVRKYVQKLIAKHKPMLVIVCMIYFPDEKQTGSWADSTLGALGYNTNPTKLQTAIRSVFEHATSTIEIEGTTVVPLPLFEVMDGSDTSLYVDRVEPSDEGGRRMAQMIWSAIQDHLESQR